MSRLQKQSCAVRLLMNKVRDAMSEALDRLTAADMVAAGDGRISHS
jgi:DNA-binding IscR family transcriptional regulator